MAKTSAERTREFRKRKKAELNTRPDVAADFIQGDFTTWLDRYGEGAGSREVPVGPVPYYVTPCPLAEWINERLEEVGVTLDWESDVEKAEAIVEALADAAAGIAELINAFKWTEAVAALDRLNASDLSDPEAKSAALQEAVRLDAVKKSLLKKTRRDFYATSVKDV